MCRLGFDIGLDKLSDDELEYCRQAVATWNRLKPAVMDGDQYRLVSPYESNHAAVEYVDKSGSTAVVYAYDIFPRYQEKLLPVRLLGLDPESRYLVREISLMPGTKSRLAADNKVFSGDYLMKVGLDILTGNHTSSRIIELIRQ